MDRINIVEVDKELASQSQELFLEYGIQEILQFLKQETFDTIKPYKPELLASVLMRVRKEKGAEALEMCRKTIILKLLLHSWIDLFSEKYPKSIQKQFRQTAQRIVQTAQSLQGWKESADDVYWKDLALVRQRMFPAGAGILDVYSGFGLTQGFSLNPIQSLHFLRLLVAQGGRKGYYQIHFHFPNAKEFNEQGRKECFLRIAEMLERNNEIRGFFGCSWYYDPKLKNVSPNLMYLQQVPLDNGAKTFFVGADSTGNAFVKSKTRERLYKEGKYTPKIYMLVWPRDGVLSWAQEYREKAK